MIRSVAVTLGPSSNVSATLVEPVGPCVIPPPNQCAVGVSAPTYAPKPSTATSRADCGAESAGGAPRWLRLGAGGQQPDAGAGEEQG